MVKLRRWSIPLPALASTLALAGCFQVPEPPGPASRPDVEIFGTGDTLVYVHDTARFAVRLLPPIADAEAYVWKARRTGSDSVLDSAVTPGPAWAWAWSKAGRYSIGVEVRTRTEYWMPFFDFTVRVDSGLPVVVVDTAYHFPFGSGNRFRVQARDPDGSVVEYFWSTRPDLFMDSTAGPEWALPDTLLGYADVYCRVRDDKGIHSATARKSLYFLPRGLHGTVSDDFRGLAVLPGGGFLAVGRTQSFDSRLGEPWIARLDPAGALEAWTTVKRSADFGVFGSGQFHSLAEAGGGFVATGTYRDSTHDDALIAGIDAAGGLRWRLFLGDSGDQAFRAGVQADAGRHVVVGATTWNPRIHDSTAALVAAVSPAGELVYARTLRRGRRLAFQCIARAPDGNLMVGAVVSLGTSLPAGYLFKLTPEGDTLWSRPLEQPGTVWLSPHSLTACRGGGYALLSFGFSQTVLQRLDENGGTLWTRTLTEIKEEWPRSGSLVETPGGDLLVGLDLPYKARPVGFLLAQFDAAGNAVWSRNLARTDDALHAVAALPGGGFAAAGSLANLAWIFSFDEDGKMLW